VVPDPRQHTRDRLAYWRERLLEHDRGLTNKTMTRAEITRNLDHWLDVMWAQQDETPTRVAV
jgi:hypothetical protein